MSEGGWNSAKAVSYMWCRLALSLPLAFMLWNACLGMGTAEASGFVLYDQSAGALAQGGAVVGGVEDPSATWFNPAGLAFGRDAAACVSLGMAVARTQFDPDMGPRATSDPKPQVLPNAFAAVKLTPRFHLGLGVFVPYGFAVNWPDEWAGREHAIAVQFSVLAINMNLAWRLSERVSVALGASALHGSIRLSAGLPVEAGGRADLDGSNWAWHANVAVMWKAIPNVLSIGAAYRGINHHGRSRFNLAGPAQFTFANSAFAETFSSQSASTSLALPDILSVGSQWEIVKHWRWGMQLDLTRWSVLDRLDVRFERPSTPTLIIERRSRDAFSIRNGVEYTGWRSNFPLRAGVQLEQSSARSTSLAPSAPDGNRFGISLGGGYEGRRLAVDVGYLLLWYLPATAAGGLEGPSGTYTSRAHFFALTLSSRAAH